MSARIAADADVPLEDKSQCLHGVCGSPVTCDRGASGPRPVARARLPEASALRHQVDKAEVVGCCDCGCPGIDISVPDAVPSAALPDGVVPAELRVTSVDDEPEGDGPTGSTSELATTTSRSGSRRSQQLVSSRLRPFPMWP